MQKKNRNPADIANDFNNSFAAVAIDNQSCIEFTKIK